MIFDEFEEMLFKNDPMGRNILGTPQQLKKFKKQDILTFIANNYHTNEMVFCSVGNVPFKKLVKWCEKYFSAIPENLRQTQRNEVSAYIPEALTIEKNTHQCHVLLGNVAYDFSHPKRMGLHLLNNILGGPGMNSRLNMSLREKNGIAYNIDSSYSPYYGTGVFRNNFV